MKKICLHESVVHDRDGGIHQVPLFFDLLGAPKIVFLCWYSVLTQKETRVPLRQNYSFFSREPLGYEYYLLSGNLQYWIAHTDIALYVA